MRRRIVVTGTVQGVFYRDSTREEAARRGVAGWVRNRDDGTVEALLDGPDHAVAGLVDWMRDGPSAAHVTDVEMLDAGDEPAPDPFEVR